MRDNLFDGRGPVQLDTQGHLTEDLDSKGWN